MKELLCYTVIILGVFDIFIFRPKLLNVEVTTTLVLVWFFFWSILWLFIGRCPTCGRHANKRNWYWMPFAGRRCYHCDQEF